MTGRAASGQRPEPEHGAAVGGDGDRAPFGGQGPGVARTLGNGAGDTADPGRVSQREVLTGAHRHPRRHFDLAAR